MRLFSPAIRYIYFDFDNVLVERSENRSRLVSRLLGVPNSQELRTFYTHGFLDSPALQAEYHSLQTITAETAFYGRLFSLFAAKMNITLTGQQASEAAGAFVSVPMRVKEGVTSGLERLGQQYMLGILTNGLPSRRIELAASGLLPHFANSIISCDYGFEKPAPTIYRIAAQAAGYRPHDIALVDDEPLNIDGALRVGYEQAVLFTAGFWQQAPQEVT